MTVRIVTDSSCDLTDEEVAAQGIEVVPLTIRFGSEEYEDRSELSVCDQGQGVPAEFDPVKSGGLGMKVVGVLAKQLGGVLEVLPNPDGRGACFRVAFAT